LGELNSRSKNAARDMTDARREDVCGNARGEDGS
jgi:hypothetical protein